MHPHDQEASHQHPYGQPSHTREELPNHPQESEMHEHDHHAEHEHAHHLLGWLIEAIPFLHGHSHGETHVDRAMETNARGVWALKVSLAGLFITALFQFAIVLLSGSAGLLADSIHNVADAFTAVPLWIAFAASRRPATRRYTYGYGRAEDLAGAIIVLMIFLSALLAAYESAQKLLHPEPLHDAGWVIAAALVGFVGNEAVAVFCIRIGKRIGSAALVADGQHARVDEWTSLSVLLGALGSLLGWPLADPLIGILITLVILFTVRDSTVTMWHRLMDAVEPQQVEAVEREARAIAGVQDVHEARLRWIGHTLFTTACSLRNSWVFEGQICSLQIESSLNDE
ncbi:putative cation efflux system protein [Ktedonobacter sp. SOSP1-85]|uniref:cation diffusion facilitator family transporter n=1 Tax=Ktedonobacter sp. SOSP1-85 TaxID=2778367 RepID=UPI0019160420|nr:cation diffusion facilitator family transporter [Ktedonobacter sp. SOSP1-85]GHO79707.1 putative cation efflux system protein [Ktedonobacter sp. SOSP1-85]